MMKKISTLLVAGALLGASAAWGVPAKRVQLDFTQPDGSSITLTLAGDEFCKYYLTDDNQIVVKRNGAYYFAQAAADGSLAPSAMLASNLDARTLEQTAFLKGLDANKIVSAISKTAQASPLYQARAMAPESRGNSDCEGVGLVSNKNYPSHGDVNALVVLVEYSDIKFMKNDEQTHDYFNALLNEEGFSREGGTGSAWDFFNDASNGAFNPHFTLAGPYTLPNKRAFYGANDEDYNDVNAQQMITDALDIMIAEGFDFSLYDNNNDKIVDNVFVFYAGVGEAQSGVDDAVWPHQSTLARFPKKGYSVGNGYYVASYACSGECNDQFGKVLDGIGTFVHEYSHVLGLPDLYNTVNAYVGNTPGDYSVLDSGPYNNDSRTPPTYSSYERNALGWMDLQVLNGPGTLEIKPLQSSNQAYVLETGDKNEFFLFENRQQEGWDTYISGHGMLVWHIDYDISVFNRNEVNNDVNHQYVDIIEAAGRTSVANAMIRKSYPFPGYGKITDLASSRLVTWDGEDLGVSLSNIVEKDKIITATITGTNEHSGKGTIVLDEGSQMQVAINGRTLQISNGEDAIVADAMGRVVSRGRASVELQPGIYVVSSSSGTAKVAVR